MFPLFPLVIAGLNDDVVAVAVPAAAAAADIPLRNSVGPVS
jgi:hypothetical protein